VVSNLTSYGGVKTFNASVYDGFTCMRIHVPAYSFCHRHFWRATALARFRAAIASQLGASANALLHPTPMDVLVLLRASSKSKSASGRMFNGLEQACDPKYMYAQATAALLRGLVLKCVVFTKSTPLALMVSTMRDATGLVSGHGAGLANVIWMPAGSNLVEIDCIRNYGKSRNFYIYMAQARGMRATKFWLNISGGRLCPPRTLACGLNNMNLYRGSVSVTRSVLDDILRVVSDTSFNGSETMRLARDCGVANDHDGWELRQRGIERGLRYPWTRLPKPDVPFDSG